MNLKRIASFTLALILVLMTASVAFAGGDCGCDMKYKYKKYKSRATCCSYGYYDLICTKCGHSVSCIESYNPEAHDWLWTVTKEPDCTHKGERKGVCTLCGAQTVETLNFATHAYGEWETVIEAGVNSNGVKERTCAACGKTDRQEFEPEGVYRLSNDKNEAVRDIQRKLIDLGYLKGKADGIFGNATLKAVTAFQADHNMEETGVVYPLMTMWLDFEWDKLNGNVPDTCCIDESGLNECALHREMSLTAETADAADMLDKWKAEYDRLLSETVEKAGDNELLVTACDYWFDIYTVEEIEEQYADDEAALTEALLEMYARRAEQLCAMTLGE